MSDSHYQTAILEWILNGTGNAFAKGVAGCGKTYTCKRGVDELSNMERILMLAFNKSISMETAKKMPSHVECKTLHALGYRAMADYIFSKVGKGRINATAWRNTNVLQDLMGGRGTMSEASTKLFNKINRPVGTLVGLAKNLCILDAQHFRSEMPKLIDYYEVDFHPDLQEEVITWAFQTYIESLEFKKGKRGIEVSFDDMIFLPVLAAARGEDVSFPKFDWAFIDEAQDLNPTQVQMLVHLNANRMLFVGDMNQAIYGFRGSDADGVQTIIDTFDAEELPLSICYRCPTKVIDHAKQYVPEIEAAPDADEGEVTDKTVEQLREDSEAGDLVLCRTNAPLVKECLQLIRLGKKALIKGREVGEGLIKLIAKANNPPARGYEKTIDNINRYATKLLKNYDDRKQEKKAELLRDQIDTIICLIESLQDDPNFDLGNESTADSVGVLIETIFVDDPTEGVVFSSIHKAKGLEAGTVWCLPSKVRKSSQEWVGVQEQNLLYVQCTRAMRRLFFVA